MDCTGRNTPMARRVHSRRAISLLELAAVGAILGLLVLAGITRFGHAKRATISTGDNHYVQLSPASGSVTSFALFRRASGGDVQIDQTHTVPLDVTVSSVERVLEYDFDGTALAAYSIAVVGPDRSWSVTVVPLTGSVTVAETTP